MDVHLIILDFTKHQKGFSVQRCETAVRNSIVREFGPVRFLFYAPAWVAQYLSRPQETKLARGVPDVIRFVTECIGQFRNENPNAALRVLFGSYNFYARRAAKKAGVVNNVEVGTFKLADYANGYSPEPAEINWTDSELSDTLYAAQPTTVADHAGDRRTYHSDRSAPAISNESMVFPPAVAQPAPTVAQSGTQQVAVNENQTKPSEVVPDSGGNDDSNVFGPEKYRRSREMRTSLQAARIFNEKPARDLLFEATKQIVSGGPLQLSKFRRILAEQTFPQSGFTDKDKAKWDAQVYFFCRLLLLSGTLCGPGGVAISHGAGADGTEVTGISPTLEDDAEGYLVEHVIRVLGNVTEFEHCPIAHAILRQFDSAVEMGTLKDRVAFLISKFSDRLSLSETGTYIYQAAKQPLRALK